MRICANSRSLLLYPNRIWYSSTIPSPKFKFSRKVFCVIGEIISVGDELTSGQRLDTNSQYLSQQLADLGIQVRHHVTVGDVLADNVAAFQLAASRADIAIISGGLGPTADDLTREAMGEAFSLPLEHREEAMQHILKLFKTRGREMPERNRVQALFPQTSRIIPNPHGTAPGIDLEVTCQGNTCRLFALPGVPAEMIQMLAETVVPRLTDEKGVGKTRWFYHCVKLFGLGESDVEKIIPDLISRDRTPRVGITVSKATITLRVAAECSSNEEFRNLIAPTLEQIHHAFEEHVFAEGEIELQDVIHEILSTKSKTLSVTEIGSGCWIGSMLADDFRSSVSAGLVHHEWLTKFQPIGTETNDVAQIEEVARRSLKTHGTDYALVAGIYPTSSSLMQCDGLPTVSFQISVARKWGEVTTVSPTISGHPELFFQRLAKTALNTLRKELLRD